MKVGLISDVHGNHFALAAVLRSARRNKVERLLIAGDLIGYYYWPGEVLAMLASWSFSAVRGNHESMLTMSRRSDEHLTAVESKYGSGLRVAIESLSSDQLEWLETLPHPLELDIDGLRLLLGHGAPWDMDQYLYPDSPSSLIARCADEGHDFVVLGHTHHQMKHQINDTVVINPGSVGQRRSGPGADWAMLDTESREVTFCTEAFDATPVVQACLERNPEIPYIATVLTRLR